MPDIVNHITMMQECVDGNHEICVGTPWEPSISNAHDIQTYCECDCHIRQVSLDMAKLKQYATLTADKRKLDEQLRKTKEELDKLEQELLPQFADEGIQNVKTTTGLVYLQRSFHASLANGMDSETREALAEVGLDWLVKETVNQQSLSAAIRERFTSDDGLGSLVLPEELQDYVKVAEAFRLRVRLS